MKKFTCLDLFAGAGGLSEGFLQTGRFEFLSHVEWEMPMVNTLRKNLVARWGYSEEKAKESVIHFDIQKTKELIHGNWEVKTKEEYASTNAQNIVDFGLEACHKR